MTFDPNETPNHNARIKVIGVGGGGTNAVSTMVRENIEGVDFISANTDVQSLRSALAPTKIQIGKELTKGLGAGSNPDVGRDATLEDRYEIQEMLTGADMVFVTAGMGGGTGTGSAAVVAQIARELGALTVGVVTKPFIFEGKRRRKNADVGIARLKESVDTLLTIPNQRLLQVATPDLTIVDAFKMADNVLVNAVKGISDIINIPGTINVDFADVKDIMSSMGQALMGIGTASGPNRAVEAARQAICSPLLEDVDIEGATGILINVTAGNNISLLEVNEACLIIQEAAHENANVIFGTVLDDSLDDEIRITVIATGFPGENNEENTVEEDSNKKILNDISNYSNYKKRPLIKTPPFTSNLSHRPTQNTKPHEALKQENTNNFTQNTSSTNNLEPSNKNHSNEIIEEKTNAHIKENIEVSEEKFAPESSFKQTKDPNLFDAPIHTKTEESSSEPVKNEDAERNQTPPSDNIELKKEYMINEKDLNDDIDKKIDEALELAERLKHINQDEDDLDIPTFLRKGFNTSDKSNNEKDQ